MGPLGHVYPSQPLSPSDREILARRMVDEAQIPLVLSAAGPGEALAWRADGRFRLPQDAAAVLGDDHEFLHAAARDLVAVCHHPDAGQLVISGWVPGEKAVTFPQENGSHGGPGRDETRGFALLPRGVPLPARPHDYLRPLDLRHAILRALGRTTRRVENRHRAPVAPHPDTLRILTYNVHSCLGSDGRLSPQRIARLIARYEPDIVALQELLPGRTAAGPLDQAHAIAQEFQMETHGQGPVHVETDPFGNAVLTRLPMRLVRSGPLAGAADSKDARGALWVAIEVSDQQLQLLNTHLGLTAQQRVPQVEALLGRQWLGDPRCHEPRVVCGDFNTPARSRIYRRLCRTLRDAQANLDGHRPARTYPTHCPLGRIDHVFLGRGLEVVAVEVPATRLALVASDHLPVLVEVRILAAAQPKPLPV
jgi:endonuclease/exonuclease/phosphatase family metal-dependent hydrolase